MNTTNTFEVTPEIHEFLSKLLRTAKRECILRRQLDASEFADLCLERGIRLPAPYEPGYRCRLSVGVGIATLLGSLFATITVYEAGGLTIRPADPIVTFPSGEVQYGSPYFKVRSVRKQRR